MSLSLETVGTMWQQIGLRIYPNATEAGAIKHLIREAQETHDEIEKEKDIPAYEVALNRKNKVMEYADCFACLFSAMKRGGISIQEVTEALMEKSLINGMDRKWKDNGDGSYSHIKNHSANPEGLIGMTTNENY